MIDPIVTRTSTPPVSREEAQQLQRDLLQAKKEIEQAKKWEEYYKSDFENSDRADIIFSEAKVDSLLAVIKTFLATGRWEAPAGQSGIQQGTQNDATAELIKDMKPGWNGDFLLNTNTPRPSYIPADASFEGTIYLQEGGSKAAFQLDPNATELTAYNHGSDIIYIETLKDGTKKAWLGKDHVTNVSVPIAVDAHNVQQGVKIDLSGVYRISDGSKGVPYGTMAGFSVIGSNFKDNIIGSQGDDIIAGLAGDDTLSGQAGKDQLYGGGWKELMDSLGLKIADDGNDTIDGGIGKDTIDGGGGFNTGFKTDETTGANAEYQTNILNRVDGHNTTPDPSSWFVTTGPDATHGWTSREVKSGEVELTETYDITDSQPNVLSLTMPEGYDMAFAEETTDGSLKITMVGKDASTGAPKTFIINVKGAFRARTGPSASLNSPFTLKFSGNGKDNIIDFHSVNFGNNLLKVSGLAGNDMILAPTNDLVQENMTLNDLTGTQNRIARRELQDKMDDFIPDHDKTDPNDYGYGISAGMKDPVTGRDVNEIVIERKDPDATTVGKERNVFIDPADYDKAYVMQDPENTHDLLIVLVKRGAAGSQPTTVVIRIKDYEDFSADAVTNKKSNLSWLTIGKKNRTATAGTGDHAGTAPEAFTPFTNVIPLIHADLNGDGKQDSGTVIDAGDGSNDFVFHAKEDQVSGQESDVEGHYTSAASDPARVTPPPADPTGTPGSGSGSGNGAH